MEGRACVRRFAIPRAISFIVLFILCWIGVVLWPAAFTHAFIALFTVAPVTSRLALGQGVCSALIFGFFAGGILAMSYNFAMWSERKLT
jgi:hypothetical protein